MINTQLPRSPQQVIFLTVLSVLCVHTDGWDGTPYDGRSKESLEKLNSVESTLKQPGGRITLEVGGRSNFVPFRYRPWKPSKAAAKEPSKQGCNLFYPLGPWVGESGAGWI